MSHSYRVLVLETLSVLLSITVNHDGIINGETAGPQQSSEEIAIQAIRGVIRPAEEAEATTTGSPTARSRSGSSLCCRTDCGSPHGLRNVTVTITPFDLHELIQGCCPPALLRRESVHKYIFWTNTTRTQGRKMSCIHTNTTYDKLIASFIKENTKLLSTSITNLGTLKFVEGESVSTFWNYFEQKLPSLLDMTNNKFVHHIFIGLFNSVENRKHSPKKARVD